MITRQDKLEVKKLYIGPTMNVLNNVIEDMIDQIHARSRVMDTEWGTIKKTLTDEGEERGLRNLQQKLFDLSNTADE